MWLWKKSPHSDGYDVARREFQKLCETAWKNEYLDVLKCLNDANDWQKCKVQVEKCATCLVNYLKENGAAVKKE